ncbi:MAG TPA: hypothetical protein ENG10_02390 [Candidatus Bathyarchaeota archaeon]|nr:hypothetical protein [Candidatus Bathyarchaeota archaeon]HEX69126.1 hypothetical protein [Candidatus Bathyarchaeota archaeon]
MSKKFYERFVGLFLRFIVLFFFFSIAVEFIFFYLLYKSELFYYCYVAVLIFTFYYGLRVYFDFRSFKEDLSLLFPGEFEGNKIEEVEALEVEFEGLPLKVCVLYRNGMSMLDIQKHLGLSHPYQVRRLLLKGLDLLIKSYERHEGKVNLHDLVKFEKERS